MKGPHVPMRMCIGCATRAPQQTLLRVKVSTDGALRIASQHSNDSGRSGYLHHQPRCWSQFAARKGAVRSLARSFAKEDRAAFVKLLGETLGPKSEVTGDVA